MKKKGDHVLAYGEVTGHKHAVEAVNLDNVDVYVDAEGNISCVDAKTDFEVTHDEHGTITLEAGTYEVRRQREYDALNEMKQRQVRD